MASSYGSCCLYGSCVWGLHRRAPPTWGAIGSIMGGIMTWGIWYALGCGRCIETRQPGQRRLMVACTHSQYPSWHNITEEDSLTGRAFKGRLNPVLGYYLVWYKRTFRPWHVGMRPSDGHEVRLKWRGTCSTEPSRSPAGS